MSYFEDGETYEYVKSKSKDLMMVIAIEDEDEEQTTMAITWVDRTSYASKNLDEITIKSEDYELWKKVNI